MAVGATEASMAVSFLLAQPQTALAALPSRWARPVLYDVTRFPYNAAGDGASDDAPAIQAAINDAAAAGGGIVFLPAGRYLLGTVREQSGIRYYILNYFSGVSLVGAGADQTVLVAGAGLPDQTRIISADSTDGKSRVSYVAFKDFSLDGQTWLQPDAQSCVGISNVFTEHVDHVRVRIVGVKGLANAEGAAFDSYASTDHVYRGCEVLPSPAAPTGSGFSATDSSRIVYEDCRSGGSGYWQGFTAYMSRQIEYHGCHGYGNRQRGLNCEASEDVRYIDCQAGGNGIGNHGDGINVFHSQNVEVTDCHSVGNLRGIVNQGSTLRVVRGQFVGNRGAGVACDSAADWENTSIQGKISLSPNGLGPIAVAGRPHEWSYGQTTVGADLPVLDLPVTSARR